MNRWTLDKNMNIRWIDEHFTNTRLSSIESQPKKVVVVVFVVVVIVSHKNLTSFVKIG